MHLDYHQFDVERCDSIGDRATHRHQNTGGKRFSGEAGGLGGGGGETNLRKERQMEGIAKAKEKGVYKGRKPSVDVEKVKELRDGGMGASAIAKEMGIGRASVYRALGA
jgi:hypothetical protein